MAEAQPPSIRWAQRKDKVIVSVKLEDVTEEKINLEEDTLYFKANSQGKKWETTIELYGSIIPKGAVQRKRSSEYYFELKKKEPGPFWKRLTEWDVHEQDVKVDSRFSDKDDESDHHEKLEEASLEDMMAEMGDGGMMG